MAAAHGRSLTDHEIAEILARLPPRCIARSRAVCRAWNAIASHPSVERVLADRPAAVTAVMKDGTRWIEVDEGGHRQHDHDPVDDVRVDRFRGRWHPDVHSLDSSLRALSLDDMTISAEAFRSWDGVLCTRVFPREPQHGAGAGAGNYYMLWNPLTKACAVVSGPAAQGRLIGGYAHPATGRFHLLHSSDVTVSSGVRDLVSPITVRILGVGDGGIGWREVPLPTSKTISMRGEGDRSVSLHGNLHWLVRQDSGKAALLVFDTAREKFRFVAAPDRPGLDPTTATRLRVVPGGGKLCVLALTQQPPKPKALEVWVLDDYSDPRSWRLREKIGMVLPDGTDLSPRFAAAAAVEVVEGLKEGEEVFIQSGQWIDAYGVRSKVWRKAAVGPHYAALLMHRESVVQPEMSFGRNALRGYRLGRAAVCRSSWNLPKGRYTPTTIPLQWSDVSL